MANKLMFFLKCANDSLKHIKGAKRNHPWTSRAYVQLCSGHIILTANESLKKHTLDVKCLMHTIDVFFFLSASIDVKHQYVSGRRTHMIHVRTHMNTMVSIDASLLPTLHSHLRRSEHIDFKIQQ